MLDNRLKWFSVFLFTSMILVFACQKWDFDKASFTNVITVGALEVGFNSAFLLGDIEGLRNASITETGFLLSSTVTSEPGIRLGQSGIIQVISPPTDSLITRDRAFAARAIELNPSTKYFFRAYIKLEGNEDAYGSIDTFATSSLIISAPSISKTFEGCDGMATIQINIEGARPSPDQAFGIVWSANEANMYASIESGNILESSDLDQANNIYLNLSVECNATYYLRGFYQSGQEVTYGPLTAFTTMEGGQWLGRSPFVGEPRKKPVMFTIGDQGYLGGGSQLNPDLKDMWIYRENLDQWSSMGDFENLEIREAATVVVNEKAYIFSGLNPISKCYGRDQETHCQACDCRCNRPPTGTIFLIPCFCFNDSIFEFDPERKSFEAISNGISKGIGQTAINISKEIYVLGGEFLHSGASEQCYGRECQPGLSSIEINTLDRSLLDPFPGSGRIFSIGFSANGRFFFGLGVECIIDLIQGDQISLDNSTPGRPLEDLTILHDFYSYDPLQPPGQQWSTAVAFPGEGRSIAGLSANRLGYVITETDDGNKQFWRFDPNVDDISTWSRVEDLPNSLLSDPTGTFVIGNRPYIYSNDGRSEANFWMYIPELQ